MRKNTNRWNKINQTFDLLNVLYKNIHNIISAAYYISKDKVF